MSLRAGRSTDDNPQTSHDGETRPLLSDDSPGNDHAPASEESSALRIAAAMYSFAVLGISLSTIGVMLPHIEDEYGLSDSLATTTFLAGPVGYLVAAQCNGLIHAELGRRGIAVLAPLTHVVFAAGAALRPPYPAFLVFQAVGFFGTGLLDGSWCAWAGAMDNANTVSGLLHGSFSTGAAVGPLVAGAMLDAGGRAWFEWYYVLLGAAVLELVVLTLAFRRDDAAQYRVQKHAGLQADQQVNGFTVLRYSALWFCAAFLLVYVGTEAAISGWIVVFMRRARHASMFAASACSSGFWAGMAAGRLSLGAATDRIGVARAVVAYILGAALAAVLFAVVDGDESRVADVLLLSAVGFFAGPLFPSGIVRLATLLPPELHVVGVSFVSSMGQVGAALLPLALGVVVDAVGIRAFQAVILAQIGVMLLVWLAFARLKLPERGDRDVEEEGPR